jgi:hypothetical protein
MMGPRRSLDGMEKFVTFSENLAQWSAAELIGAQCAVGNSRTQQAALWNKEVRVTGYDDFPFL